MAQDIGNSNLLEVWASSGAVVEPDISKVEEGWQLGEQPPHEFMNWLQNTFGEKLNHVLSNGTPQWNSSTSYGAGSTVQRTGSVWIAMEPNSNSEPATGNTNWSRLLKLADASSEATADKLALRDENGTFKVGEATDPAHPVRLGDIKQDSDITVTVGAGADFETINAALTHLSNFYPEYKNTGVTATIELQAGFEMAEQVLVRGIDFGWVTIIGVDAQTTINNTALTIDFTTADYDFGSFPAFGVSKGGVLPRIGQLFIFDVAGVGGSKHGVMAVGAGSNADILPGCGVVNAGEIGIYATRGASISADDANASGAGGSRGMYANTGSKINARDANVSGAAGNGIQANNNSTIDARDIDASNAGSSGIRVSNGSIISASGATGTTNIAVNTLTSDGIIFQ